MKLSDYFAQPATVFLKETTEFGEQTNWLEFCDLELKGSRVLVIDAQFVPSEQDGLLVELFPAKYAVQAKVTNFGGDLRISRLRASLHGTKPQLGRQIGETWTDTASTGICDFEIFSKSWGTDNDTSYKIIEPFLMDNSVFGVAELDVANGAVMPFVSSGFGDGSFAVFELTENGQRIGFEIEFIPSDEKYSFGATPFQRQIRIREMEQSAKQGDAVAQYKLGKVFLDGDGVQKNPAIGVKWLEQSARNKNTEAALALGTIFKNGKIVPKDFLKAREFYELAASSGSVSALNHLGVFYRHGYGVPVDNEKAVSYYQQAANQNLADAQYNLAVHLSKGWGVTQNYEEAAKWYRLAADQGNKNAIFNLGNFYFRGDGVKKDEAEAARLFLQGHKKGHGLSAFNLGRCYEKGIGVEQNLNNAITCYRFAALSDVSAAQRTYGMLFKNGPEPIAKNLETALKWLRKAVVSGDAEAHYELGLLYETGEGVTADKVEACKLFQKALDGGFAKAVEKLNELYGTLSEAERASLSKSKE